MALLLQLVQTLAPTRGRVQLREARRLLERARAHASAAEQPLLRRAEELVEEATAVEDRASAADEVAVAARVTGLVTRYAAILRELALLHPAEPTVQVAAAATLYALPDLAETLDVRDEARDAAWRREAIALADAALRRFPEYARAHAYRGYMCSREVEDELRCVRYYARCVALAPADSECRRQYGDLARQWSAPRCEGDSLKRGIALHLATSEQRPGTRSVAIPDAGLLFVNPEASFTAADLAAARTTYIRTVSSEWDAGTGRIGPATERREEAVYLELLAPRRPAFTKWLREASRTRGAWLAISDGSAWLRAVPLAPRALRSPLIVSGLEIGAFCTRAVRRPLPAELPAVE